MVRDGVCIACHEDLPEGSLAVSLLHHIAEATGMMPETDAKHSSLLHKVMLLSAWVQVGGMVLISGMLMMIAGWLWRRRRQRRSSTD